MRILKIFFSVLFFFNSLIIFSQPIINSVEGEIQNHSKLTVSGSGYGAKGPNIIIFDSFTGNNGDTISLTSDVGNWSSSNIYHPALYINDGAENMAALFTENQMKAQLTMRFDPVQEFYVSYGVQIPTGYSFPMSSEPETFSKGSNWKLSWLMDGGRGSGGNDDVCLPTWPNGVGFSCAGNDKAFQFPVGKTGTDSNWFSFKGWNRFSAYLKGGDNPTEDAGILWAQGMSTEFGQKIFSDNSKVLFDGDDSDTEDFEDDDISQWNVFKIPGWFRGGGTNVRVIYDDVYIATGDRARARIEIGDKPTYADCRILDVQIPTSWSADKIEFTLKRQKTSKINPLYLYIVDSLGVMNTAGYPLEGALSAADNLKASNELFSVFPNPTVNQVYFNPGTKNIENISIDIYNISGKHLASIGKQLPKDLVTWNTENIPSGTYIYKAKIKEVGKEVYFSNGKIIISDK